MQSSHWRDCTNLASNMARAICFIVENCFICVPYLHFPHSPSSFQKDKSFNNVPPKLIVLQKAVAMSARLELFYWCRTSHNYQYYQFTTLCFKAMLWWKFSSSLKLSSSWVFPQDLLLCITKMFFSNSRLVRQNLLFIILANITTTWKSPLSSFTFSFSCLAGQ